MTGVDGELFWSLMGALMLAVLVLIVWATVHVLRRRR
jgi:hypothetical protein